MCSNGYHLTFHGACIRSQISKHHNSHETSKFFKFEQGIESNAQSIFDNFHSMILVGFIQHFMEHTFVSTFPKIIIHDKHSNFPYFQLH